MGYQYGYPQFNYYPPFVYYLGEIIHLIGFQFIDSVKILFIFGFILSAFIMFIFLKSFLWSWPAVVGSLLYTYAPYKAVEVYVRGALSEFWSFVFFPLIFWSIYKLVKTKRVFYIAWTGLSIGLLLTTHILMSMIFLPLAMIWGLGLIFLERESKEAVLKLMAGIMLAVGLGSFFVLPVIFERSFVHLETLLGGYFDWRQHFVSIYQLFLSNHFGYGSSYLGAGDDLSLSSGIIHWILASLAGCLAVLNFSKHRKISILILIFILVELINLFLMHQRSTFIWENIPALWWLQFPWRFLSSSVFILSMLGAVTFFLIKNKKLSYLLGLLMILAVVILHGSFFKPKEWFNLTDYEKFSGKSWERQLTISIFDYLPVYAKLPPTVKAPEKPEILEGKAEFISYLKGSNYQIGQINAFEDSVIRLPLFDFPGMEVKIDKDVVSHLNSNCLGQEFCLGLISFKVPKGEHIVKAQLNNTPIRSLSNIISLVSLFTVIILFLKFKNEGNN